VKGRQCCGTARYPGMPYYPVGSMSSQAWLGQPPANCNQTTKVFRSEQTRAFRASTMAAMPCSLAHERHASRDNALAALQQVESPRSGCANAIPKKLVLDFLAGPSQEKPAANGNKRREEMMRNRWLSLSMVLLGVCLFLPQKSLAQSTISCNSDDERRHSCAADTRGGVRLATQHSGSACTEGYSWGSDSQGIWVDHGCRADFTVGGNGSYQDQTRNDQYGGNGSYRDQTRNDQYARNRQSQTFACNSDNMRRHSCYVETRGGDVRLVRQLSDAACTKGYSWGTNRRGIWVDHGCRADFVVTSRRGRDSWR